MRTLILLWAVAVAASFAPNVSLAEQASPDSDTPYTCSGSVGAEKCVCVTAASCKSMLNMCKNGTMSCAGPVCSCDMARKKPLLGIGGKPKAGAAVNGQVGN